MQETVLITGASSGIGRELASCFAVSKSNLVLVARSVDKLEQIASQLRAQHGADVRITCLCPGPTETGFGDVSGMSSLKMVATAKMSAADVAAVGYAGFRRGSAVVIPGWTNKAMTLLSKMMPSYVTRKVVKKAMEPA